MHGRRPCHPIYCPRYDTKFCPKSMDKLQALAHHEFLNCNPMMECGYGYLRAHIEIASKNVSPAAHPY